MTDFLTENFLLKTPTARRLYCECASALPIVDYHCHVSPREICEDKRFANITELWLSGDHYKWRLMRANGVDEYYITGNADPYEKFIKFATLMPKAIGNPMYHWCHLELRRYFGYEGVLNADTADAVWKLCEKKLAEGGLSVREIIRRSNVAMIGTTDDPIDTLEYHKRIAEDRNFATKVLPSFRPDKALNVEKTGWQEYIGRLSEVCGVKIDTVDALKKALRMRIAHFAAHGCRASDHGLDCMVMVEADATKLETIFQKGLRGEPITESEAEAFKTELLVFCAAEYACRGWVMQLHFNCLRNPNSRAFATLGPDTGFDCIGPNDGTRKLAALLDRLYREEILPRTVVYSLDPADNAALDSLIGAFQGCEIAGKLQHGSAWWFNDHKQGMRDQMIGLANLGLLGNFIGMLTDSRSFLSYTRHEYFRRILCDLIGEWVENGEYPCDEGALKQLVYDICYGNASRYFDLEKEGET